MSIELSSLGRVRIAIESGTSAYAVDQSASPANFIDLPVMEGTLAPSRKEEKLDPMTLQTMLDDHDEKVRGPKSCEVNFSTILAGTGVAYTGGVAFASTTTWALGRLLQTIMGGSILTPATTSTVLATAGSTTTTVNVTAGHGTDGTFTTGGPIGVVINGRVEVREVLSTTANSVTVPLAFSAAPSAGAAVYTGYTFWLSENPVDSLQLLVDGMEDSDKFVYAGLQGGFDLDVTTGQFPKLSVKLSGSSWTKRSSAPIAAGANTLFSPAIITDCEFIVGTVGSTTRNLVHCTGETWTPGIEYLDVKSSTAASTVLRKRRNRGRAIAGKFTTYRDASSFDFEAADSGKTDLYFQKQLGSTAGSIVTLVAPTVQCVTTNNADAGGIAGVDVEWEGRNSTVFSTPTAGTYRSSAFKIFVL
ncbi:MAG: hypothetical protein IPK60_23040 [Sandaracinaceae bacterium]|nr:hypothetical protein [Sandaracinaceae bacterium]